MSWAVAAGRISHRFMRMGTVLLPDGNTSFSLMIWG